jgi:phosphoserine phosphatase
MNKIFIIFLLSNTKMVSERRYDLVAFDMDGVLLGPDSCWSWIHQHYGVDNRASLKAYLDGAIDDREFMRRDISLWKANGGEVSISEITDILYGMPITPGVAETLGALKRSGMKAVIVSGGIDLIAERVARSFDFDDFIANGLEHDPEGRLTGEGVLRVDLTNKKAALDTFIEAYGVQRERVVAIGNSFVDVSMFMGCGLSIAYNPIDDHVRANADVVLEAGDMREVLPFILDAPVPR